MANTNTRRPGAKKSIISLPGLVIAIIIVLLFVGLWLYQQYWPSALRDGATTSATTPVVNNQGERESAEPAWVVDVTYVQARLAESRFTLAWSELTADSCPVSSPESKAAFLAALKWKNADGTIGFNPLALLAMLRSWSPGALETAGVSSWHDLVTETADGRTVANQTAINLTNEFFSLIMTDKYFVWLGEAPATWTNSGSTDDGILVVRDRPGVTASRLAWFVRTEAQMEDAATGGSNPTATTLPDNAGAQLCRCGNPVWVTPPPEVPTGRTDEKDPSEDILVNTDLPTTVADTTAQGSGGGHTVSTTPPAPGATAGATDPTPKPAPSPIPDSEIVVGSTTETIVVRQSGKGGYWEWQEEVTYTVYKDGHKKETSRREVSDSRVWHADSPPPPAPGNNYAGDPGE